MLASESSAFSSGRAAPTTAEDPSGYGAALSGRVLSFPVSDNFSGQSRLPGWSGKAILFHPDGGFLCPVETGIDHCSGRGVPL